MRKSIRTVFAGILVGSLLGLAGIAVAVAAQDGASAIKVRRSNEARTEVPATGTATRDVAQNRREMRTMEADQRGNGPLRREVRGDPAFSALEPYGTSAPAPVTIAGAEIGWMDTCPHIPPLSSALHIQPPLGVDHGEKELFDPSLHEFVVVSICEVAGDGGCDHVKEYSAGGPGNGLNQIVLQDSRYHVNWQGVKTNKNAVYEIRFLVGDFEIGSLRNAPGSAGTVPIKFRIDRHPLLRARVLHLEGMTASDAAAALVAEFGLGDKPLCVAGILKEAGFGCVDIGQALADVFMLDAAANGEILRDIGCSVIDITIVLRDVYGLTPDDAAGILKDLGFSAVDVGTALRDVYSLDAAGVATILKGVGFSVTEVGTVLRDVFSLNALAAVMVLKEVGYSADDIGIVLRDVYNQSAAEAGQTLADAGYTPTEIAMVLRDVFEQNVLGVVLILGQIGSTPVEIGVVLRDVFAMDPYGAAKILHFVDYSATDVGTIIMEVYGLDASDAVDTLANAGYSFLEIGYVLRDVYGLDALSAAALLETKGYAPRRIQEVIILVYDMYAAIVDIQVRKNDQGPPDASYTGVSFSWPCTGSGTPCTNPHIPGVLGEYVPPSDVNVGIGGDTVYVWVKYDFVESTSDREVLVELGTFHWPYWNTWCPSGWGPAPGPQGGKLTTGTWGDCDRNGLCVRFAPMNQTDTFIANLSLSKTGGPEANCPALCPANLSPWPMRQDPLDIHKGCGDDTWVYFCFSEAKVQPPAPMEIQVPNSEKVQLLQNLAPRVWLSQEWFQDPFSGQTYFGDTEPYFPASVEWAFQFMNRGFAGGAWRLYTKQSMCDSDVLDFFRGFDGNAGRPTVDQAPVYAYWVEKEIPVGDMKFEVVDLVYFFYYPYNRGKYVSLIDTTFGHHVGDWEHVTVRLMPVYDGSDNWPLEPVQMYLSAHDFGGAYAWDQMEKVDAGGILHPAVYSAWGSHGVWKSQGRFKYDEAAGSNLIDITYPWTAWDTWNLVEAFDYGAQASLSPAGDWPLWMSRNYSDPAVGDSDPASGPIYRWGNGECGSVFGYCRLCDGPTGPIDKGVWTAVNIR